MKKEKREELLFFTSPVTEATKLKLPLANERISAGFPSPADSYMEGELDLNLHLVKNPPATFFVRVSGDSMINAGIFPNDILIVDKSLEVRNNDIVIAVINGDFTVKRFIKENNEISLIPENKDYDPIPITSETDFEVWGVVTNVIHGFRK